MLPSLLHQLLSRSFRHEHADAALLVENPFIHQHIHTLGRRSRVDLVQSRELIGGWNLALLRQPHFQYVILDLL
ncbi:hypothetical protein D3C76_1650240 [compost metagenome]